MKLKNKIILISILPILTIILIVLAITFTQKANVQESVGKEIDQLVRLEASKATEDVYLMLKTFILVRAKQILTKQTRSSGRPSTNTPKIKLR
jgi:signal transduction histidine kinase